MHSNEGLLFDDCIHPFRKYNSRQKRCSTMFLRNEFECVGEYDIPLIRKQHIELNVVNLIACTNTIINEKEFHNSGVHFFVDDFNFISVYDNPKKTLKKYSQYRFCCSPDFSLYSEMGKSIQIHAVFQNRWCGAWWQSHGIKVIPTISWDKYPSFDFCFDGVETGSIVAIATYGCSRNKFDILKGFDAMMEKINPEAIICYGKPFSRMRGNIIPIEVVNPKQFYRKNI